MKILRSVLASILCLCLVHSYPVRALSNGDSSEEEEVICPDSNPLNCYPRNFIPTEDWQIVKQGQVIPPGLEVKLDLENMNREARLIKDTGNQLNKKKNHELVISNGGDPEFQNSLEVIKELSESNINKENINFDTLVDHLDILIDWSSDIESGVIIAQNVQPLIKLSGLYNKKNVKHSNYGLTEAQYIKVQEMTYRILASSFRNNIEAQEVLLNFLNEPELFLQNLVKYEESDIEIIIKRKLGLLSALLNNGLFDEYFDKGDIEYELIKLYPKITEESIKFRIMNILDDFKLEKRDEVDNDVYNEGNDEDVDIDNNEKNDLSIDQQYALITQKELMKSSLDNDLQKRDMLESLGVLKRKNKSSFKVNNQFLDWLDKQIVFQRNINKLRKRDSNNNQIHDENSNYLEKLIELRHEVFGNPLATRKEYYDEL